MARYIFHIGSITLLILAIILVGQSPARSDSSEKSAVNPMAAYRSPSSSHKVIVQSEDDQMRQSVLAEGGALVEDYGAFALYSVPSSGDLMSLQSAKGSAVRDDMNVLLLRAGMFDTTGAEPLSLASLGEARPADRELYLVQMIGPVKKEWVNEIESSAEIISYIPNNAYLVRASAEGLTRINKMKSAEPSFIQYTGTYKPAYKIAPELALQSEQETVVTVQLITNENTTSEIQALASTTSAAIMTGPVSSLNFTNVRMRVSPEKLSDIARSSDVVWIEPWTEPVLHDERQGLIVSANYTGNQLSKSDYLTWLQSKGLAAKPDFLVDLADSGIDQGLLDPQVLHKDFLDTAGLARVGYARYVGELDVTIAPNDTTGHGTINAAIVGGYNTQTAFPYVDSENYSYGVGIAPLMRLGVTKIFAPDYTNPPLRAMVDMMYRDGARVSSNSWGAYNNNYTTESQTYDSLVRDARGGESGNQEMTIVFSSGNKGAGSNLSTPGNAKNVICVGASENIRSGSDGCHIDSTGGDDINSLISFSSGGPCADGRVKPDIVAPGTHIQGARSQDRNFAGSGVCGPIDYPPGQSLYTWSSGTSHSAPAVSAAAALLRQFFQLSIGHPPSPAMVKAFLTNSTTYMTGNMAGDNLPGNNQGWGLLNIGRALDNEPRMLVDQDRPITDTGQVITITGKIADPKKPFRITLAWTDAPGNPAANPVANDLDLQVDVGNKTYLGNHFVGSVSTDGGTGDRLNNIESVWAPGGVSGSFSIRIVGANIVGDGIPGNNDTTDQDFALVVYNAAIDDGSGGGGGGGLPTPIDSPPSVNVKYPVGGETLMVGNIVRILWDSADDKGIQSQRIDFSPDGVTYNTIGAVDGRARSFDWRIPSVPTPLGRIKITAFDGVNLPVSSVSPQSFEITQGPPDNTPPQVLLIAPDTKSVIGGGTALSVKWRETDNVGVIQRVIELSTDGGISFQQIISLTAPSSGTEQSYDWQVPAAVSTDKARVRLTVYDGAGNSAAVTSSGKFEIWAMPIITDVEYRVGLDGAKDELVIVGRNFRVGETEVWVNGVQQLGKIKFADKFITGDGTATKVSSFDKKLSKRVPVREDITLEIHTPTSGQISPPFAYRRPRNSGQ